MHSPTLPPPTRSSLLGAGLVCAFLSIVLLVMVAVRWSPLMSLDTTVAEALHRRAVTEPGLVHVNRVLTDWVWDPWTMRILIAVAVIALWRHGARLLAAWVALVSALSVLVQQGLKAAVGRERPQWPDPVDSANYAAFPSGHAMTAMVSCGLLLWLLRLYSAKSPWWWAALTLAVVSVVGVSVTRVYLGVHWPTDVLGGLLLGAAVVAFAVVGYGVLAGYAARRAAGGSGAPL
ncbi:phosphatase PAP2 family protein [Streptomyces sp. NBC_01520]|uniref:phosphatase PAP2 family protein n=1 Tax=Streptomyces sp. NBC_01520 TaxID=2903892 RepID=UPI00386A3656